MSRSLNYRKRDPKAAILRNKKYNARRDGIGFDLEVNDLSWPTHCPALGLELNYNGGKRSDNTATLDRIDPSCGYFAGNVQILSEKANRIKSDATAAQLFKVAHFMYRLEQNGPEEIKVSQEITFVATISEL